MLVSAASLAKAASLELCLSASGGEVAGRTFCDLGRILAAFLAAAFSAAAFFTGASVLPFALALALPLGFRVVFGKMLRSLASDCGVGGAVAAASLAGGTVAALSLAAGGDGAVASLTSPSSKARQLLDRLDVVEEMPAGRFMFTMARGNGAITRAFAKQLRARFLGLRPASEDELAGRAGRIFSRKNSADQFFFARISAGGRIR